MVPSAEGGRKESKKGGERRGRGREKETEGGVFREEGGRKWKKKEEK